MLLSSTDIFALNFLFLFFYNFSLGRASARGKQKKIKTIPKKKYIQTVTPEQKILLEKMQFDQLVREGKAVEKEVVKEVVEASIVNADVNADVEVEGDEEVENVEKAVEKPDVLELTFVSSLTFAEMMLLVHKELNNIKNKSDDNIDNSDKNNVDISSDKNNNVGDVPLFYNPLTLVVKGNVHNAELSLLRREGTYVRTPHEFVLKCHELVLICV